MKNTTALLLALLLVGLQRPANGTESTVLRCGAVLDVETSEIRKNIEMLIVGGTIREMSPSVSKPDDATMINLAAKFCLPGLMDMHVHPALDSTAATITDIVLKKSSADRALIGLRNLQLMLHMGFTTVRVPGGGGFESISLRDAFERGDFIGPRMLVAASSYSALGGHADLNEISPEWPSIRGGVVPAGSDNAREAVRREKKYGADWIKITASGGVMSQRDDPAVQGFTDEEIAAFAEEAHRLGMKITAHVHGNPAGYAAARAGFDSIEHGTMLDDETIMLMRKNGVTLVPTLYVLEWILERGAVGGITPNNFLKAQRVAESHKKVFRKAYEAGVTIAMGSDPIFPFAEIPREFSSMVRAGMKPWDALRAGTINSARLLGLQDEIGSLVVGKRADIVAVTNNPIDDITELQRVGFVMQGGKVVRNDF